MQDAARAVIGMAGDRSQRAEVDQVRLFLTHWRGSLAAIALGTVGVAVAWGDMVPLPVRAAWCALGCANYLVQALVCRQLELVPSLAAALPRRIPWLLGTVAGSGVVWGLVPWMAPPESAQALLFAALFNIGLIFAVVNAPGTRAMVLCAVLPVMLLTTSALLWQHGLFYAGLACAGLCGLILLYGLRVQAAIQTAMVERHTAHDLADTLRQQQQRLIELEGERALLLERQRLMRDLHDGLGSTLTSSLIAVEAGDAEAPEVAAMLRDCVDDLRAVIDSLEPIDHDLVALLATLRFRVGPRLARSGIALEWDMQDLPPLPWLGPPEALQVVRMVQEMLTNIVRHARARQVRVSVRPAAEAVELLVADDGCGFDTGSVPSGRGLRFMAQRAALLDGRLSIDSAPGQGTAVRLQLPRSRGAVPAGLR